MFVFSPGICVKARDTHCPVRLMLLALSLTFLPLLPPSPPPPRLALLPLSLKCVKNVLAWVSAHMVSTSRSVLSSPRFQRGFFREGFPDRPIVTQMLLPTRSNSKPSCSLAPHHITTRDLHSQVFSVTCHSRCRTGSTPLAVWFHVVDLESTSGSARVGVGTQWTSVGSKNKWLTEWCAFPE